MKHGFALHCVAAAAPKCMEGSSLLSPPLWRVYRELPFPHQGEAGFASQGDSMDKAKVTSVAPRSCSSDCSHVL